MSIHYSLEISSAASLEQIRATLCGQTDYQLIEGNHFVATGIAQGSVVEAQPLTRERVEEDFHFTPKFTVLFRLDKKSDFPNAFATIVRGCLAILRKHPGDAVLLLGGVDSPVFIYRDDQFKISALMGYWTPSLLSELPSPYDFLESRFAVDLIEVAPECNVTIDGIRFSGVAYLEIRIDGVPLSEHPAFADSFPVWKELEQSAKRSGQYLLFTSASGIADDAGWEKVAVELTSQYVLWKLNRDGEAIVLKFSLPAYRKALETVAEQIQSSKLPLEPRQVVAPEAEPDH